MPIRVLKKDKDKKEEQKEKPESGSSVKDIFKSYGKYDGKPIELKRGGLSPKQKKIAAKAPPPDKIDAKDFAVLKAEKAKGRGMGLQDESIKPGKVMKARVGKSIDKKAFMKTIGVFPKVSGAPKNLNKAFMKTVGVLPTINKVTPTVKGKELSKASDILKKKKLPGAIGTALGIGAMMVPAAYAAAKQYKDYKAAKNRDEAKVKKMGGGMAKKYSVGGGADTGRRTYSSMEEMRAAKGFKPGETPANFNKRKVAMEVAKKAAKATTIGKIVLPIAAAGVAASQYLQSKIKKKEDKNKKTLRDFREQKKPGIPSEKTQLINKALDGKNKFKFEKKMAGGMAKKYNRGGGADTGAAGERKSKMYVLLDKMKSRRAEDRITERDIDNIPPRRSRPAYAIGERKSLRQSATPGYLPKPAIGKMGGGMMNKPMGYKSGTMVKARGCKLGRTRPTKMY